MVEQMEQIREQFGGINEKLDQLGNAIAAIQHQISIQSGVDNRSSPSSITPARPSAADLEVTRVTELVGLMLEVEVDENWGIKEMNEALVDEDSTLENDSTMEENSMNIPTKGSLVHQTQKVFDEMTERETKLWHEGYRESKSYKLFTHQNITFMCSSTFPICHKDTELDGELLKPSVQLVSYENEVATGVEQTNPTLKILQRFKALLDNVKVKEYSVVFSKDALMIAESRVSRGILYQKEQNVIGVKRISTDPYRTLGTILKLDISKGEVHQVAWRDGKDNELILEQDLYEHGKVMHEFEKALLIENHEIFPQDQLNFHSEGILSALVSILAVSNLETIVREVLTYDIVSGFLPSLAVQLLLYMVDMSCVLCSNGLCSTDFPLLALLLGSVAMMMIIVVAFFFMVMRLFCQNNWKIATAIICALVDAAHILIAHEIDVFLDFAFQLLANMRQPTLKHKKVVYGINSWCSKIRQCILQLKTRRIDTLNKGLRSKTERVSRDSLAATAWLGLELIKGSDGMRRAACEILLLDATEKYIQRQPKVLGDSAGSMLGRDLEGLIQRVREYKKEFSDSYISAEHLVLGFAEDNRFGKQLFKDFQLSLKTLKDIIQSIWGAWCWENCDL